jgi:hypothetical protein
VGNERSAAQQVGELAGNFTKGRRAAYFAGGYAMHSLRSEIAAGVGQSVPLSFYVAVRADVYYRNFDDAVMSAGVPSGRLNVDNRETLHPAEPLFKAIYYPRILRE